jgi:lipoprotein-anchoring transpeptidase ErfK/SrfK
MKTLRLLVLALSLAAALAGTSAQAAHSVVSYQSPDPSRIGPGDIVIVTSTRTLYFLLDSTHAMRYPVAVPKAGKDWMGETYVTGKFWQPAWEAPSVVRNDHPELPPYIPGGAPNNPMGMAAMTLQESEVAIHGTTAKMRASIGTAASYGCIRMLNEDVVDLYSRVNVDARVLKMQ